MEVHRAWNPTKYPTTSHLKKSRRQILPHFSMRQAILMILDPFSSIFHNCWLLAIHGNSLRFQVCPPLRSALNGLSAELSLRMGAHERSSCTCWDHFGEGKTIFFWGELGNMPQHNITFWDPCIKMNVNVSLTAKPSCHGCLPSAASCLGKQCR